MLPPTRGHRHYSGSRRQVVAIMKWTKKASLLTEAGGAVARPLHCAHRFDCCAHCLARRGCPSKPRLYAARCCASSGLSPPTRPLNPHHHDSALYSHLIANVISTSPAGPACPTTLRSSLYFLCSSLEGTAAHPAACHAKATCRSSTVYKMRSPVFSPRRNRPCPCPCRAPEG